MGAAMFGLAGGSASAEKFDDRDRQYAEAVLKSARARFDGEGMLVALERLVDLEKQTGHALTHPIDFEITAGLIADRPDLVTRLLRLEPIQYRGAIGGPFRRNIALRMGMAENVEIDFEVDDQAIAYLRSEKPFSVRMSVYEIDEHAHQNLMKTADTFPLCVWQPKSSGKHLITIQPKTTTPLDIELITN